VQVGRKRTALAEPLDPIVRRRRLLKVAGVPLLGVTVGTDRSSYAQDSAPIGREAAPLSARDLAAIEQLNARYFHALDGLLEADSNVQWADTFTADGTFVLRDAEGNTIGQATGASALVEIYATFPDVATTRHWINNLLIEPEAGDAKASCYIIAMDIGAVPSRIARTGIYKDHLVRVGAEWRFQRRELALDANSRPP
jgi:hypothetical protein